MTRFTLTKPTIVFCLVLLQVAACEPAAECSGDGGAECADDKCKADEETTSCGGGSTSGAGGQGSSDPSGSGGEIGEPVPLKEAKLIIEHNATDEDTGFQGFLDGDGWQRIDVIGPEGPVLSFEGHGKLRQLGLTELFFETVEPENAKVPLARVLEHMPEGEYVFRGPTTEGGQTVGVARLDHDIPAGPLLTLPAEGETVSREDLVVSWEPVTKSIMGDPITVVRYQLIVEKDEDPHPTAIGKSALSVYVPASVTSVTVPFEFLEAKTAYLWEVLAIAESGNQTLSSSEFTTE
jgi:hypothetical protein